MANLGYGRYDYGRSRPDSQAKPVPQPDPEPEPEATEDSADPQVVDIDARRNGRKRP